MASRAYEIKDNVTYLLSLASFRLCSVACKETKIIVLHLFCKLNFNWLKLCHSFSDMSRYLRVTIEIITFEYNYLLYRLIKVVKKDGFEINKLNVVLDFTWKDLINALGKTND